MEMHYRLGHLTFFFVTSNNCIYAKTDSVKILSYTKSLYYAIYTMDDIDISILLRLKINHFVTVL